MRTLVTWLLQLLRGLGSFLLWAWPVGMVSAGLALSQIGMALFIEAQVSLTTLDGMAILALCFFAGIVTGSSAVYFWLRPRKEE